MLPVKLLWNITGCVLLFLAVESFGGQRLLQRADINIGSHITSFFRIRARTTGKVGGKDLRQLTCFGKFTFLFYWAKVLFKASFRVDRILRSTTKNTEFRKKFCCFCWKDARAEMSVHMVNCRGITIFTIRNALIYKYLINKLEFSDDDWWLLLFRHTGWWAWTVITYDWENIQTTTHAANQTCRMHSTRRWS